MAGMGPRSRAAEHRDRLQALTVTRHGRAGAVGAPGGAPTVLLLGGLSLAYLGIAAAVALYLLPVGFGLQGSVLLATQSAVLLAGALLVGTTAARIRRHQRRQAVLADLASGFGWTYRVDVGDRMWGGSVDEQIDRRNRTSTDLIDARDTEVPFDSVERTFVVGDGEGATMHTVRAVRIPLPSEVARIALRSRRGAGALSLLPRRPRGRTELRLEGNFSDVFEVSVPPGYEMSALYVLTPDLMAVLLDTSADLDLEVVDSTLHVYFPALDLTRPEELGRFLTAIAVLHDRFGRRTLLYRDEHAESLDPEAVRRAGDTLAHRARELETRSRWWPVLVAVLTPLVPLVIAVVWIALAD